MPSFVLTTPSQSARSLANGQTGLVDPTGGITVASGDAITASGGAVTLTVLGYLRAEAQGGSAIAGTLSTLEMTIGEAATLSAAAPDATIDAAVSDRFTLDTAGEVTASTGDAIRVGRRDGAMDARIDNSGNIVALDGVALTLDTGEGLATLDNAGRINGAAGAVILRQSSAEAPEATIWNGGTITASGGDAVTLSGQVVAALRITNDGTIAAPTGTAIAVAGGLYLWNIRQIAGGTSALSTGAIGYGDEIINCGRIDGDVLLRDGDNFLENFAALSGSVVTEDGADRVVNATHGEIGGGIVALGDGADSIVNRGAIDSDIQTGDGADTISGDGDFTGAIETGGGNDTMLITGTSSGTIRMGDGRDVLVIDGTVAGPIFMDDDDDTLTIGGRASGRISMGKGDDSLIVSGDLLSDIIFLGEGDDTIDLRQGSLAGTVTGELGRDVYYVSDPNIRIVEPTPVHGAHTLAESDEVRSTVSYEIADADLENLTLLGDAPITGTGNAAANALTGNLAANMLWGFSGDDTLLGGTGNDVLWGGADADDLRGELGDDVLHGGEGADRLDGGEGDDTLEGGEGADRLADQQGANLLDAGEGADFVDIGMAEAGQTVRLGSGDDNILSGGGADTISGGTGMDRVSYLRSEVGVMVDLALGTSAGGHASGDRLDGIEWLEGSRLADTLIGDADDNQLRAVAGGDRLVGGAGRDTLVAGDGGDDMAGGSGQDLVSYESSPERVVIDLSTGFAGGGHAFGDTLVGIEDVTGSLWNDRLVGDGGANVLTGAFGDDELEGGGGADTLRGGVGSDRLLGGSGADVFVFEDGWGADTIVDFERGADLIDLRAVQDPGTVSSQIVGPDILIDLGPARTETILLLGAAQDGALTADDFLI